MIRLLHVDDELMDYELTKANLKKAMEDIEFKWLGSAVDALELIKTQEFDCILCDYQMAEMDGLEFLIRLRENDINIPFIFLTGQGNEQLAARTFRAGADDYYAKEESFTHYQRLAHSIQRVIQSRKQQTRLLEARSKAEAQNEKLKVIFSSIDDAVFVHPFKEEGFAPFIEVNDIACTRYGYSRDEFLQLTAQDITIETEFSEHQKAAFRKRLFQERHVVFETFHSTKAGIRFPVEINANIVEQFGKPVILAVARDITERKKAEEKLLASERRFREIIEDVSEIAFQGYDEERNVIFWNKASEKLYGYSQEEALGSKLEDLIIPAEMKEDVIRMQKKWVEEGIALPPGELILVDKYGNDVPVFSSHMLHETGGRKEMFCLDIDLKPIKKIENELKDSRRKLEDSYRELEAFSRTVAHDLKAPLRHMHGFAEMLKSSYQDVLDNEGLEFLKIICNSAGKMTDLVDDILRLSKASSGEMIIERVDLSELARRTGETLKQREQEREIVFIITPQLEVDGDLGLLNVVMSNLLGNAWKFTRKTEGAKVSFGIEERKGEKVFFVKDNGAGFDQAEAEKLFAPFQRLHPMQEFEGTGIGLATVERIIKRHGGRVWAESKPGEGATFFFTLSE